MITGVLGHGVPVSNWVYYWGYGDHLGTPADPYAASVTVPYSKASVDISDIVPLYPNSTEIFYGTDSTFTTPETGSVPLTAGATTTVYILDMTENNMYGSYYLVNITRQEPEALASVTTPAAITGVPGGTENTASALGLPSTVTLKTSYNNTVPGT